MDSAKMTKQMIDFHKATFDNTFSAIRMLQDQTENMVNTYFEQSAWLSDEGKRVTDEWLKAYKSGRDALKKAVDDSFKKVEDFWMEAEKTNKSGMKNNSKG